MSKQPRIRIRAKDKELIQKLNKAVSAKRSNLEKMHGVKVDIPTRGVTTFTNRDEFNNYVEEMKQFTKRSSHRYTKNKEGVSIPTGDIEKMKREIKRINQERLKDFKKIEKLKFKDRGIETNLTVKEQRLGMGDIRYNTFKPLTFNLDRFRNKKEFDDRMQALNESQEGGYLNKRRDYFKQNYITGLQRVFGEMSSELQTKVNSMTGVDFMNLYYTENLANIDFIYDLLEMNDKYKKIKEVFGMTG